MYISHGPYRMQIALTGVRPGVAYNNSKGTILCYQCIAPGDKVSSDTPQIIRRNWTGKVRIRMLFSVSLLHGPQRWWSRRC